MPKNVHFPRNFEKRDETRNRHEKREVQNCREPGKFSSRDETRDKHYYRQIECKLDLNSVSLFQNERFRDFEKHVGKCSPNQNKTAWKNSTLVQLLSDGSTKVQNENKIEIRLSRKLMAIFEFS